MSEGPKFLTLPEWEEFNKPDRCLRRAVLLPKNPKILNFSNQPQDLVQTLIEDLKKLEKRDRWFRGWCISVRPHDGMSWTAESIYGALGEAFPRFKRLCIPERSTVDGLPAIARIVGERTFLRLANRHGLTKSFVSLRRWMMPAIVTASFLLAFAVKLLEVAWKVKSPATADQVQPAIMDSGFWVVGLTSVLVGLLGQHLTAMITTRTKSKSMEDFCAHFKERQQTEEYENLVEDLAKELRSISFPRFVIVDHFEALESTTQRVIDRYFRKYSEQAGGSEMWIVLEQDGQKTFSAQMALSPPNAYGYQRTELVRQAALERSQKQALVELLGLGEAAIDFESVRRVCEGRGTSAAVYGQLFRDYRAHHPADESRYGELDFLYLLALTARPGHVMLTDRFVRNNFSVKSGVQSLLLADTLRGTKLIKAEFEHALSDIRKKFGSVLFQDGSAELPQLRVMRDPAEVLEGMAEELDLPPAGLGHLFWALFWRRLLLRHPLEALWIQKLAHHVLESDISRCDEKLAPEALAQLVEAALFTMRGCFRVSVLGPMRELVQRCALLLDSGDWPNAAEQRALLAELCWGTYMILGDESLLRTFTDLVHSGLAPVAVRRGKEDEHTIASGLQPLLHDFLMTAPPEIWATPAAEQLRLRSIWLALTLYPVLRRADSRLLLRTAASAHEQLGEVRRRIQERAKSGGGSAHIRAGEMVNLSIALWCAGLSVRVHMPPELQYSDLQSLDRDRLAAMVASIVERSPAGRFSALLDFAGDALTAALAHRNATSGVNLTADGLIRDLAVTAAASVVAGCHLLDAVGESAWTEELDGRANAVLQSAAAALEYKLPVFSGREELLSAECSRRIDELMHLCTMMWHAFGMDQMRHFMTIRRSHFNALCSRGSAEGSDRLLLESEGAVIDRQDFAGLIANCVAADSLFSVGELSAFYLSRAGKIALDGGFGRTLRHEFADLVIENSHALGLELGHFVEELLMPGADGHSSGLMERLRETPPAALASRALAYLNATGGAYRERTRGRVIACVRSLVAEREGEPAVADARALLDLVGLEDRIAGGAAVDVEAEVQAWSGHAQSWIYPWFIELLHKNGHRTELVRRECIRVLDHDAELDGANCGLLLASSLAEELPSGAAPDGRIVVRYLRTGIQKWQSRLSAEMNVQIYMNLCRLDSGGRTQYMTHLVHWQQIQLHRDHLRRFPELLALRRFFLIFAEYFRSIHFWGLSTDVESEVLRARLQAEVSERRAAVADWAASGQGPAALATRSGKTVVLSAFLIVGTYLFEEPLASDEALAEHRASFNAEAERSLFRLLHSMVKLPDLPPAIKDLLRRHSERLYHYSLPPDLQESALQRAAAS